MDTVLIDAESEVEKLNTCPPLTASVLVDPRDPFPTLVSTPLANEIVAALNVIVLVVFNLRFPSAPTVM